MKFIWKALIWQRRQKATLTLYQQVSLSFYPCFVFIPQLISVFDAGLMKNMVNLDTLVLMKKSHMVELPYDPHGPTRFWLLYLETIPVRGPHVMALAMKENPKRKKKFINWVTLGHVLSSFPKQLRITEVITWPVWPREHDPVENHSESWRVQGRKGWLEPIPKGRRPALRSHGFVAKT